jgi:ribosomal protein L16 Arg81 hydroxylase
MGRFNFSQCFSQFFDESEQCPQFTEAKCYQVVVEPGDILYVPIGWWHEVKTGDERAVSLTYFFNLKKNYCLLWHS